MLNKQNKFMDTDTLIKCGTNLLEQISQKHLEINKMQHPVHAQVQPGFLRYIVDHKPPREGESMQSILEDTERKIFPGLTLWTHPNFFGYYGSNICHPAILAEMFSSAFGTPGFNWLCSPVQTELENVVSDWIVQALKLPEKFLMNNKGGGTIADTVSDAIFITIHTAKYRKMKELGIDCSNPQILKFVGYYSENAHNSAYKGLLIKDIPFKREIPTYFDEIDQNFQIDLFKFEKMINEDITNGLIPFWCQVTWGTTSTCACEDVQSIAQICNENKIWLNLDAAYAGSFWVIEEQREKVKGIELVDSVQVNFAKMMMCGNYGSLFFIGDKQELAEAMGGREISRSTRINILMQTLLLIIKIGKQDWEKDSMLQNYGG